MEETLAKLEEKIGEEFVASPYNALQYVQSFVARKKKMLKPNKTSRCVFHGAKSLVNRGASIEAGVLLVWFIESDDLFHLVDASKVTEVKEQEEERYCDTERLLALLSELSEEKAEPIAERIYSPLHQVVVKSGVTKGGEVDRRMGALDGLFANIFEATQKWRNAYRVVIRLGETERAARILNSWSAQGYLHEKPLFFARAALTLLSEGKKNKANEIITHCTPFVTDNVSPPAPSDPSAGSLAVWHLAVILTHLAVQEPRERVDKLRLFNVLITRYSQLVDRVEPRLNELMEKIGIHCFGTAPLQQAGPDPMALMQALMSAQGGASGGGRGGGGGAPDYQQMLMRKMQANKQRSGR